MYDVYDLFWVFAAPVLATATPVSRKVRGTRDEERKRQDMGMSDDWMRGMVLWRQLPLSLFPFLDVPLEQQSLAAVAREMFHGMHTTNP